MDNIITPFTCDDCKYKELDIEEEPCATCIGLDTSSYEKWAPEEKGGAK